MKKTRLLPEFPMEPSPGTRPQGFFGMIVDPEKKSLLPAPEPRKDECKNKSECQRQHGPYSTCRYARDGHRECGCVFGPHSDKCGKGCPCRPGTKCVISPIMKAARGGSAIGRCCDDPMQPGSNCDGWCAFAKCPLQAPCRSPCFEKDPGKPVKQLADCTKDQLDQMRAAAVEHHPDPSKRPFYFRFGPNCFTQTGTSAARPRAGPPTA